MKIAIIGCGNMGTYLVNAILQGEVGDIELHTIVGTPRNTDQVKNLAERANCRWTTDPSRLDVTDIDLIIEAAGQQVVKDYMLSFLEKGKNVMIISVGALNDKDFFQAVYTAAKESGSQILLPSGAIGGLDAIRSAALGGLNSVELTTRKHPDALKDAPYVIQKGIDLDNLQNDYQLFYGNALDATIAFPANLNVAGALSLAGIGPERTMVRIVASPNIQMNTHEIIANGDFGRLFFQFENFPSSHNKKTSHLAILSVMSVLKDFGAAVKGVNM